MVCSDAMFYLRIITFVLAPWCIQATPSPPLPETPVPPTESVRYADAHLMGIVSDSSITGTSGLCASGVHPNVLYVHNDRGDNAHLYAVNGMTGQLMTTIKVTGASNHDWEDIACGPCGAGHEGHSIYIGDIGDHSGGGARDVIYKVREPATLPPSPRHVVKVDLEGELHFTWSPPGLDAETLMVDPEGVLYVITKAQTGNGQVGVIPPPSWINSDTVVQFTKSITLPISTSDPGPLGGDISKDGRKILIKTSNQILYWYVPVGVSYLDVLSTRPLSVPYQHQNHDQAVGWDQRGQGYFTLAEGRGQGLYYYGHL